jgi:hypothetical protein
MTHDYPASQPDHPPRQSLGAHASEQSSEVTKGAWSQQCTHPPELRLEVTADTLKTMPSGKRVDVYVDGIIRIYGPQTKVLPSIPDWNVSDFCSLRTDLRERVATRLKRENSKWWGRAWNATDRLDRATRSALKNLRGDPTLKGIQVVSYIESHSFAGSRLIGDCSRYSCARNGVPEYTEYPAEHFSRFCGSTVGLRNEGEEAVGEGVLVPTTVPHLGTDARD